MKEPKFDFSRPTGDIGLLLLVMSLIAYAVWLVISIQNIWSSNAAEKNYFIVVSIVLIIALVLLSINYRHVKKLNKKIPEWIVFKGDSKQVLPPLCQKCRYPARWAVEFDSWYCDKCNYLAGPF